MSFFRELIATVGASIAGAGRWTAGRVSSYLRFVARMSLWLGLAVVALLVIFFAGVFLKVPLVASGAFVLIGLVVALYILLTLPLATGLVAAVEAIGPARRTVRFIGFFMLWAFLIALYFSLVPVSNHPTSTVAILLIGGALALTWAVSGVGLNPRGIQATLLVILGIVTLSLFMPKTFSATNGLLSRVDQRVADSMSGRKPRAGSGITQSRVLEIRSDPIGADVHVGWNHRGKTPLRIQDPHEGELIVATMPGMRAGVAKVPAGADSVILLTLPPSGSQPRSRVLLSDEGMTGEEFQAVRTSLLEQGVSILGSEEAAEFHRERALAGGLSRDIFRAWASSRFGVDVVLVSRVQKSSQAVTDQDIGYEKLQAAAKGIFRADATVRSEIIDLPSGNVIGTSSGSGTDFALQEQLAVQKALAKALTAHARAARGRLVH
jgi:hypothetical protein